MYTVVASVVVVCHEQVETKLGEELGPRSWRAVVHHVSQY